MNCNVNFQQPYIFYCKQNRNNGNRVWPMPFFRHPQNQHQSNLRKPILCIPKNNRILTNQIPLGYLSNMLYASLICLHFTYIFTTPVITNKFHENPLVITLSLIFLPLLRLELSPQSFNK